MLAQLNSKNHRQKTFVAVTSITKYSGSFAEIVKLTPAAWGERLPRTCRNGYGAPATKVAVGYRSSRLTAKTRCCKVPPHPPESSTAEPRIGACRLLMTTCG